LLCDRGQVGRITIESWRVLANNYSFWPSDKRSILTIGIRAKVTSSISGGQLLRTEARWAKSQSKWDS